jgi:hypothetical protein
MIDVMSPDAKIMYRSQCASVALSLLICPSEHQTLAKNQINWKTGKTDLKNGPVYS